MDPKTLLIAAAGVAGAVILLNFIKKLGAAGGTVISEKIALGAKIIDVRSAAEYAGGHYKKAVNIPVDQLPGRLKEVGAKDQPVIVYCASGMRSASAAALLKREGFVDVTNAGGLSNMP